MAWRCSNYRQKNPGRFGIFKSYRQYLIDLLKIFCQIKGNWYLYPFIGTLKHLKMLDNDHNKLPESNENQPKEETKSVEKNQEAIPEDHSDASKESAKTDEQEVQEKPESKPEKEVDEKSKAGEDKKDQVEETDKSTTDQKDNDETKIAIEAVEKEVAASSEKISEEEIPIEDYKSMDLAGIVVTIQSLLQEHPIQSIRKHVDILKKTFNRKFGKELKEAKDKFLKEGGNSIDFHYENPVQASYNDVLLQYKRRWQEYQKNIKKAYEENLLKKKNIIEELKDLVDNGDGGDMFKHFKDIQQKWREVGPVSREYYTDLWRTYHFHTERFYDLLHLRNDLRDLDFQHNLDEKLKLIARAEILAESENVNESFKELQELHRLWKEEIGPVSRDLREKVWERFSAATKKIHDKRHEIFEELKGQYQENVTLKEAVIEEIENYDTSGNKTHHDWQKSIKEIENLRERFFSIGRVPRNVNSKIWKRFKEATKKFNQEKNNYYKDLKNEQKENLDKKMKLVEQAESLKDSEDWDTVTEIMKKIQNDWKKIGHVPRSQSDKIWKRFKEACNHYFDRLHNFQDAAFEDQNEVFIKKKEFYEDFKEKLDAGVAELDLKALKTVIKEWNDLGIVPMKQRYINSKFNKLIDTCFDKLSIEKKESILIRYENMINEFVAQKDFNKINYEVQFVRKKIDEISREKQQLENNMQFFSNTDKSNPMIKKILKNVDKLDFELSIWEAKLAFLRSIS